MIRNHVHYVPAGLESLAARTGQIFVKMESNENTSIHKGSGYKCIRLHDRTLHLIQESNRESRLLDTEIDCDYVVPYQSPVELRNQNRLILVNPIHASSKFTNIFRPYNIKMLADSGGFQLFQGVKSFVHPDDPIEFYNKHTDIGMPLDFPIDNNYESVVFDAITKLMVANDDYMLPRLNKKVKLALISHGSNVEMRKRRLDAIYRETPVVAIGAMMFGVSKDEHDLHNRLLFALANAMYVISQTRDTAKYFHFLGVTSRFWLLIYAFLVGTGYIKSCGGDSVSFRMGGITGNYKHKFSYMNTDEVATKIEKFSHKSVMTSCACPICQAVSDLNIMADFQLCESHNLWYSTHEKNLICDSVEAFLDGRLTFDQLAEQWLPPKQRKTLRAAFKYIDDVSAKGFFDLKKPQRLSLFPTSYGKTSRKRDTKTEKRYIQVIRNYEKFYKRKFL